MTTATAGAVGLAAPGAHVDVQRLTDVLSLLPSRPTLLLSASVPYELDATKVDLEPGESVDALNARYWATSQPARIRLAVSALTRVALSNRYRLVFGAHPSISPMVLQAASDMEAPAGSILVFQSEAFAPQIPRSTLQLANWESGQLVMTAQQPEPATARRFPNSLSFMREAMASVGGLQAAVFIGGLKGVELEAAVFGARHRGAPCYAIESTGSAAAALARESPGAFQGRLQGRDADLLRTSRSYSLVAHKIVQDVMQQSGRP